MKSRTMHSLFCRAQWLGSCISALLLVVSLFALVLCCGDVSAQEPDNGSVAVTRWVGPGQPGTYAEYLAAHPKKPFSIKEVPVSPHPGPLGTAQGPRVLIIVNDALYQNTNPDVASKVTRYMADIQTLGYQGILYTCSGGTAEDLKAYIRTQYQSPDSLVGCVLIGDLPCAFYEIQRDFLSCCSEPECSHIGYTTFPCDLFICDVDGQWDDLWLDGQGQPGDPGFGLPHTGIYDAHSAGSGDQAPEIFLGRIDACLNPTIPLGCGANEIADIVAYLDKLHQYYDENMVVPAGALTYIDDEWLHSHDFRNDIAIAYPDRQVVICPEFSINDYCSRLASANCEYGFVQLACHSTSNAHQFLRQDSWSPDCNPDPPVWHFLASSVIRTLGVKPLFYNLYACSALRFTDANCLGKAYLFSPSSAGLAAVGSTKAGGMLEFFRFYGPLSQHKPMGETLKEWFCSVAPYDGDYPSGGYVEGKKSFFYGMTLLGDPLVVPVPDTVALPTLSHTSGTYNNDICVTMSCPTPGAVIHYTTDGSDPGIDDPVYINCIPITGTTTLKARAFKPGYVQSTTATAVYTMVVCTPVITPNGGTYNGPMTAGITCATASVEIWYTTDGISSPSCSSGTKGYQVSLDRNTRLVAIACKAGYTSSSYAAADFVFKPQCPTFSPPPGTYDAEQHVTISSDVPGSHIHYTTDGSDPTPGSPLYPPDPPGYVLVDRNKTIKAIVSVPGWTDSDVCPAAYNLRAQPPVFNPPAGQYCETQTVTAASSTSAAVVHYTTDGSDPTCSSPILSEQIQVSHDTTFKAIACASTAGTLDPSDMVTCTYTFRVANPTFNPPAGYYNSPVALTFGRCPDDASIRYTINGTDPTCTTGTLYTGSPIPLTASSDGTNRRVKAIACKAGWPSSDVVEACYVLYNPSTALSAVNGSREPAPNATGVPEDTVIQVAFNRDMDLSTVNSSTMTVTDAMGNQIPGVYSLDRCNTKLVRFTPDSYLELNAAYTVTVTTGVTDRAGNHPASPDTWSFTTCGRLVVKQDSPYNGPGNDWEHAYHSIQAAIDAATSVQHVWVAAGTYMERITLEEGVSVYGGFVGTETSRSQRDWNADGNKTTIDGGATGTVVTAPAGLTQKTFIDGFTIRNGTYTQYGVRRYGGGIFCNTSSPTITHNRIIENHAVGGRGAGIACIGLASPRISNNLIAHNEATWDGTVADPGCGGGILCVDSSPTIVNNVITQNEADSLGGGVCVTVSDESEPLMMPRIANNIITENASGSGVYCAITETDGLADPKLDLHCNDLYGNQPTDYEGTRPPQGEYISCPPAFVAPLAGDYRLNPTSCCIDAGCDCNPGINPGETDMAGSARMVDALCTQDTNDDIVDIGMYELADVAPVTLNLQDGGVFYAPQSVIISCATPGVEIHYTTDGTAPTREESPEYTVGEVILVACSLTLRAKAWKCDLKPGERCAQFTLKVVQPTLSVAAGVYGDSQSVTMDTSTAGAVIHYTIDGSEPTESSPIYTAPVQVDRTMLLRARAFLSCWAPSDERSADYTMVAAAPQFTPPPGEYHSPQLVTITTETSNSTIHYKLDGGKEQVYTSPILIDRDKRDSSPEVIDAWITRDGFTDSALSIGEYTLRTIPYAKRQPNGAIVQIDHAVVTMQSATGYIYIEADNRACAIKVNRTNHGVSVGMRVNVRGQMITEGSGEKAVNANDAVGGYVTHDGGYGSIEPIYMPNRSLSAGDFRFDPMGGLLAYDSSTGEGQRGVVRAQSVKTGDNTWDCVLTDPVELNTIGLLVRNTGVIVPSDTPYRFWIDDGSRLADDSCQRGLQVYAYGLELPPPSPTTQRTAVVTGILRCYKPDPLQDLYYPYIWVRNQEDIVVYESIKPTQE